MTGEIPASIANLKELELLSLRNNHITPPGLSGNIPTDIGTLSKLKHLLLNENQLSGHLPSSITQLTNLETLILDYNNLTSLPNLSTLTNLEILRIEGNSFPSGPIPDWFYELRNLEEFFDKFIQRLKVVDTFNLSSNGKLLDKSPRITG